MGISWRDPETIVAIENYVRIATGIAFISVLLFLFITNRLNIEEVIKAIGAIMAIDRLGIGAIGLLRAKAKRDNGADIPF